MERLFLSFTFFLLTFSTLETATIKRCNLQFKCSLEEHSIYATDGKMCYVFRNGCFLARENCNRKNKCQPDLYVTTREKCKCLCIKFCPDLYKPVCCFDNEIKRTFSNQCELTKNVCESGKTCSFIQPGRCNSEL